MNVETGRRIHGYRFTELSMPQHIIDKVHDLADAEGAPNLDDDGCPLFEWEIGAPVNAENEEIIENAVITIPTDEADDSDSEDEDTDDINHDDDDDNQDDDNNNIKLIESDNLQRDENSNDDDDDDVMQS